MNEVQLERLKFLVEEFFMATLSDSGEEKISPEGEYLISLIDREISNPQTCVKCKNVQVEREIYNCFMKEKISAYGEFVDEVYNHDFLILKNENGDETKRFAIDVFNILFPFRQDL